MKVKLLMIFLLALVAAVGVVQAQSIPVYVEGLEINDVDVDPDWQNVSRLDLERADSIELKIIIVAFDDAEDIEIEAFLSGYEYNDFDSISDSTHVFDVEDGVRYVKKLTLNLPDDLEEDDYKLRILITDRNGWEESLRYDIKVDVPRHKLVVEDIMLSPSREVKAGRSLIVSARLDNRGEKDEDDVKITISIPELGVKTTSFVDEVEYDEQEESEQMLLRIPTCAQEGTYLVEVEAEYDRGHETARKTTTIDVVTSDSCRPFPVNGPAQQVVVVQDVQPAVTAPVVTAEPVVDAAGKSKLRTVLEVILFVLLAILVIVGLVVGFKKLRGDEEDF